MSLYYSIRYTVPGDSKLDNGDWRRVKASACIKPKDEPGALQALCWDYGMYLRRIYADIEWEGVVPVDSSFKDFPEIRLPSLEDYKNRIGLAA